jgi:tRNA A37 N6-isopentenylltransferase MiaA
MLKGGLIEEVERLRARGDLHLGLPSMRCVATARCGSTSTAPTRRCVSAASPPRASYASDS